MLPQGLPTTSFHAPMIGGSHPGDFGVTGAMKVRSADYIRDSAPNMSAPQAISTQNGMSDQMLRQMWQNLKTTMPGADENALVREFHNRAGKYGVNGGKWLEDQNKAGGGQVQTEYVNGQTITPSAPGVPLNMLGPDRAGGTMPPGFAASERGMAFGGHGERSAPIIGPKQGYSPVPEGYTNPVQPQSRFTAADATRSRNMEADRMQIVGEGQMNAAPVTGREAFQTGAEIAQTAADQPARVQAGRDQTARDIAAGRDKALVDAAKARGGGAGGSKDPFVTYHEGKVRTAQQSLAQAQKLYGANSDADSHKIIAQHQQDLKDAQDAQYNYLQTREQQQRGVAPQAGANPAAPAVPAPAAPAPVSTYGEQPQQQNRVGPDGKQYVKHSDGLWYPAQ